jgi:hypothetical protein
MSTAKVVPIRPVELTRLQQTILLLLLSVDPEPMDGIDLMLKARIQNPTCGLVEMAKAVTGLEGLKFLRPIDTRAALFYALLEDGRTFLRAQMAARGGSIEEFLRIVRESVTKHMLEQMPAPGGKPC